MQTYTVNNILIWLCIDDKAIQHTPFTLCSAVALKQLIIDLSRKRYMQRRIAVRTLYKQRSNQLLTLMWLCEQRRAHFSHNSDPVGSMVDLVINWLLRPYEASNCLSSLTPCWRNAPFSNLGCAYESTSGNTT